MIYELVQRNFIGIAIILFLILFIVTNNNFNKKTNRLFLAAAICVLILIIEEAWEVQLAKAETFSRMRIVLSALGYTLRPMTAYFLVMIIHKGTRKWTIIMSLPVAINMFVVFSALFGGWAFSYTQNNEFVRGPLGVVPFITAAFYILLLVFLTLSEHRRGGKRETMTIIAIVLLTVTATIMESVFHFRSIQSACSALSVIFYYLFLHTNQNNRDPLTGALTRRRFYFDAEKYRTSLSAVISMDLNHLKELNDQYGHIEGDNALITMVDTVNRCINRNAVIYRTGGDEFMILCHKYTEEEVQALIKKIAEEMKKTKYRCAMGYAMYSYITELDHICQKADRAMYENKRQMKEDAAGI